VSPCKLGEILDSFTLKGMKSRTSPSSTSLQAKFMATFLSFGDDMVLELAFDELKYDALTNVWNEDPDRVREDKLNGILLLL
jgi:hypothetical protein